MDNNKKNHLNKRARYSSVKHFKYSSPHLKRRDFLRGSAGAMGGAWLATWPWETLLAQQNLDPGTRGDWDAGRVRHLLPAVNDSCMLIKASFLSPMNQVPSLTINGAGASQTVAGLQNDTACEFWQFYVEDLNPNSRYELGFRSST